MDETFAITKYDSQHINVLTDPQLPSDIEPGSLSPESILNRASKTTPYELLKKWSENLTTENEKSELYPIPDGTEWEDIPHTMKMARLASILGLHISSRYGELTPEMISRVLGIYESNMIELGVKDFTEKVISDWKQTFVIGSDVRPTPVDAVDRIVFLPQSRIIEINEGKDSFCMITPECEALIPFDTEHAPLETNSLYSAVAHELTHLARQNKMDNVYSKGKGLLVTPRVLRLHNASAWVVEGTAQLAANKMAEKFDHKSNQNNGRYPVETTVLEIVQKALDIPDHKLIMMPISKLIELINATYEPDFLHYTAFDELTDDIEALKRIHEGKNQRPFNFAEEMEKFVERWYPTFFHPETTNYISSADDEDDVITGDK